jgi:hypothetical protein
VDLLHQVFSAVAGELGNLINFLVVVRIFLFTFLLYSSSSFLLSVTINFLGSYSFMRRSKSVGEFVPEIERFLHKRKREAQNNIAMAEHTLKEYATPSTDEP